MTREEAIELAIKACEETWNEKTCKKIRDTLEQEPCEDAISRQAVIDVIERWLKCSDYNEAERHIMRAVQSVLYDLPSVNPQEPCTNDDIQTMRILFNSDINTLCNQKRWNEAKEMEETRDRLMNTLKQEPKTGHWKRIGYDIYECSICGQNVMTSDICAYRHCHCCGTRLESEGKE